MRFISAVALCLFSLPVFAASFTEDFSPAPPSGNWTTYRTTWNTANGDIRNDTVINPGIAVYNQASWQKNFVYNAKIYGDYPAEANRVGVVFGYQSSSDYWQVMVSMTGKVTLGHVVGGAEPANPTTANIGALTADAWHSLQVFVNDNAVTVRVDGVIALRRIAITTQAGFIGVIARSNVARFDDINLVDHGVTQLFRGTFSKTSGGPVDITPPDCNPLDNDGEPADEDELVCYSDIVDEDASGFKWPATVWGGVGRFQYITRNNAPQDENDPTENADVEIAHVPGWTGNNSDVVHQILVQRHPQEDPGNPQVPYIIRPPGTPVETPLYFRFRLKSDGNFGTWHMPWQFKTGDDSYRVSLLIETSTPNSTPDPEGAEPCDRSNGNRTARFVLRGDEADSAPIYWQTCVNDYTVPAGTWMKVEIYFDRGPVGGPGRVWLAIDGVRKIERTIAGGLRTPGNTNTINRIMLPQSYGGNTWPREQWVDDIEIWNGFPADAAPHAF